MHLMECQTPCLKLKSPYMSPRITTHLRVCAHTIHTHESQDICRLRSRTLDVIHLLFRVAVALFVSFKPPPGGA